MEKLIGREIEKSLLQKYMASNRCELIVLSPWMIYILR